MSEQRVLVVGGGLAGLAATMKLAELGVKVDLMSLTPVKRSHSVCAQGGINSVNDLTRQQGDNEWSHLDDTVYGGDFLQHQPPVKEMAYWAPRIINLLDRLGVPFNRTATMYKRILLATAFVGALAIGSLGSASKADAAHYHRRGCAYGAAYAPYVYGPPPRSVYYRYGVSPAALRYSSFYGAPAYPGYYGVYSRGPAFRLSIGF